MVRETVIRAVGNSAGMTIPKPILDRYHLAEGDAVFLVETDEGVDIAAVQPVLGGKASNGLLRKLRNRRTQRGEVFLMLAYRRK